ncbi:MAG: PAS domain S-box protein, partial [Chitinivibrionales bacterium]|nr:PAS domain S-box protein [Chitinivibrionales bacterium]
MRVKDRSRRQPQRPLLADEQCLKLLSRHTLVAVCIVDLQGNVVEANDAAVRMSGYGLDELKTLSVVSMSASAEDAARARAVCRQAVRRGATREPATLELVGRSGRKLWAQVEGSVLRGDDGKAAAIVLTAVDVTRSKAAEHRGTRLVELLGSVRGLNRQLREIHERLELAVTGGELGAWEWHVATGDIECSDRCT